MEIAATALPRPALPRMAALHVEKGSAASDVQSERRRNGHAAARPAGVPQRAAASHCGTNAFQPAPAMGYGAPFIAQVLGQLLDGTADRWARGRSAYARQESPAPDAQFIRAL